MEALGIEKQEPESHTVDGRIPALGCPKCFYGPSIKTFLWFISGAGCFPSNRIAIANGNLYRQC